MLSLFFTAFYLPFIYGLDEYGGYINNSFYSIILAGFFELLLVKSLKNDGIDIKFYAVILLSPFLVILFICLLFEYSYWSLFLYFAISMKMTGYFSYLKNANGRKAIAISESSFLFFGIFLSYLHLNVILVVAFSYFFSSIVFYKSVRFKQCENFDWFFSLKLCFYNFFSRLNEDVFFLGIPYMMTHLYGNVDGAKSKLILSLIKGFYKIIPVRYEAFVNHNNFHINSRFVKSALLVIAFYMVAIFPFAYFVDLKYENEYSYFLFLLPVLFFSNLLSPVCFIVNQKATALANILLMLLVVFTLYFVTELSVLVLAFLVYYLFFVFYLFFKVRSSNADL